MGIPHKKIIFSLIIGVGMVGTSWLFFTEGQGLLGLGNAINKTFPLHLVEARENCIDSDNDGLCDWEELLFGTDPSNRDTDGDRVPDGEQYASLKNISDIEATDNILHYLNQVGEAVAGGQVTLPQATLTIPPDRFDSKDIHIIPTTKENVSSYTYRVLYAISIYRDAIDSEPLTLVNTWLQTNDPNDLGKIKDLSEKNKNLATLLVSISVPNDLAANHLELVNSVDQTGNALSEVSATSDNPQRGFFAAALSANFVSKRSKAIVLLTDYFNRYMDNQS